MIQLRVSGREGRGKGNERVRDSMRESVREGGREIVRRVATLLVGIGVRRIDEYHRRGEWVDSDFFIGAEVTQEVA